MAAGRDARLAQQAPAHTPRSRTAASALARLMRQSTRRHWRRQSSLADRAATSVATDRPPASAPAFPMAPPLWARRARRAAAPGLRRASSAARAGRAAHDQPCHPPEARYMQPRPARWAGKHSPTPLAAAMEETRDTRRALASAAADSRTAATAHTLADRAPAAVAAAVAAVAAAVAADSLPTGHSPAAAAGHTPADTVAAAAATAVDSPPTGHSPAAAAAAAAVGSPLAGLAGQMG